jgi:hypothetical protein
MTRDQPRPVVKAHEDKPKGEISIILPKFPSRVLLSVLSLVLPLDTFRSLRATAEPSPSLTRLFQALG